MVSDDDLIAVGADLEPGSILGGYRRGLFPMGLGPGGGPPLGWWSPQQRGVLTRGDFHSSRSLRRSARRFTVTADRAFEQVVAGCADPSRDGAWITRDIARAYIVLHRLGWAHSVEVWSGPELVGGLYGLAIGGLFAAESKFHTVTDASKVAVWGLVTHWFGVPQHGRIIDVQWLTPHLATLGVRELDRAEYLRCLPGAVSLPWQPWPRGEIRLQSTPHP